MVKQLTKVGNSNALVFSKDMMGFMGVEEKGEVNVEMFGGVMMVAPTGFSKEEMRMALEFAASMKEDAALYRRLA